MELIKYNTACRALAEAKAVDEVKNIRDIAMAMETYAQQAQNLQMELDAVEIRARAERRLGEMIEAQKETVGLSRGGGEPGVGRRGRQCRLSGNPHYKPTLASVGIDKNLANRARKMASGGATVAPPESDKPTLADAGIDKELAKRARKCTKRSNSADPRYFVEQAEGRGGRPLHPARRGAILLLTALRNAPRAVTAPVRPSGFFVPSCRGVWLNTRLLSGRNTSRRL